MMEATSLCPYCRKGEGEGWRGMRARNSRKGKAGRDRDEEKNMRWHEEKEEVREEGFEGETFARKARNSGSECG